MHILGDLIVKPSCFNQPLRGAWKSLNDLLSFAMDLGHISRAFSLSSGAVNSPVSGRIVASTAGILKILSGSARAKIPIRVVQCVMTRMISMARVPMLQPQDLSMHCDRTVGKSREVSERVEALGALTPPCIPFELVEVLKPMQANSGKLPLGERNETIVERGHARSPKAGRVARRHKRLTPLFYLIPFLFCLPTKAQVSTPSVRYVGSAPSGTCSQAPPVQVLNSSGAIYTCNNGTWGVATGGGGGSTPGVNVALSCASELGAQMNSAVTTIGASGGVIQLPNCTNATMTTTATNIPQNITIRGYGKKGTIITCSVVGDCFQFLQNATTDGEIGAEISSFAIQGSNTGQTLMHFIGASGYTLHDLQFQPYPGVTGNTAAVCLEFDNAATGEFTERNRTYNVYLERTCTIGVLFNQNVADSSVSFGYNTFEFGIVTQNGNYGLVFNGPGSLYGGSLTVTANHVGPNGGVIQFNNSFTASGPTGSRPGEHLFVTAEENGSGAGAVITATGTNLLAFDGAIFNGSSSAPGLVATASINGGSAYSLVGSSSVTTNTQTNITSATQEFDILPNAAGNASGILGIAPFGSSEPTWKINPSNGANLLEVLQTGPDALAGFPLLVYGKAFAGNNAQAGLDIESNAGYQFNSTTTGGTVDTSLTRPAANTVAVGTTGALTSGLFEAAGYIHTGTKFSVAGCGTATSLLGGSTSGQFTGGSATCTPVITTNITAPNGYSCSMQDQTTATALFRETANNATTITFTAGGVVGATDVINFQCSPF